MIDLLTCGSAFSEQRSYVLSTKFAQRPAPRKRPWICKRSPPCLRPPTLPPTLLCSFSVQKFYPLPVSDTYFGTFLLRYRPMLALWKDSAVDPPNAFTCEFAYSLATGDCQASGEWQVGTWLDWGTYDVRNAGAWPKLFYLSRQVATTNYSWNATLQITG